MRLGWAIVAGAIGAGVLAWWLAREAPRDPRGAAIAPSPSASPGQPRSPPHGPALYRWRDAAGVVHVTDVPPQGRDYTLVDVAALERRNTIDPNPAIEAAR